MSEQVGRYPEIPVLNLSTDLDRIVSTCMQYVDTPAFKEPFEKFLNKLAIEKPPLLSRLVLNGWENPEEPFYLQVTALLESMNLKDQDLHDTCDLIDKNHDNFSFQLEKNSDATCILAYMNTPIELLNDTQALKRCILQGNDDLSRTEEGTGDTLSFFLVIKT